MHLKPILKRAGLVFLEMMRPFYEMLVRRKAAYFKRLRSWFDDPYLCGMLRHFNVGHEWIFKPAFDKVHFDAAHIQTLKELSSRGTLVYVMKNQGQLEYSFFNHRLLKESIPLALFANGSRTLYWRPLKDIFKSLLARLDYYYQEGLLPDPIQSGYLENLVARGESVLLNLKVSRELIFGTSEDPMEFIPSLITAARKSPKPVYLVTQQFLYDRHPEKTQKSWVDWLFGEKTNPGMFRKFIMFLMSYRRRAMVKFGEPFDLKKFVDENPAADIQDLAARLHNLLLERFKVERKSITGPALQPREKMLEKMLRSQDFKRDLDRISQETGRSKGDLHKEMTRYFMEIAAACNYSYIDLYDRLISWLVHNIYDGLDLDAEGLARVKAVAGKNPIVLVPSHRSHVDYLLLSWIFYQHDLTLPHVCAGINLKFWPAERFIRRGGGFYIRRSLGGNKVYRLVLEHYLKLLVREGYSVEFFIEGTRSRTGKLLKPKMGVLSMLADAYLDGGTKDLYFVPISINYERILEEKSYVDELHGTAKKKEGIWDILMAGKKFRKKYGKVFIRFAEPISAKSFFDGQNVQPKKTSEPERREAVEKLAYHLTYQINRVSVVTSTSLVATALLTYPKKGIPESEALERVGWLARYLEYKGAGFSEVVRQKPQRAYKEALQRLTRDRLINSYEDFQTVFFTVDEPRRPVLDYHKNNSLHFFTSLYCVSKVLSAAKTPSLSLPEIKEAYESLKTLLSYDFTFSERASLDEHLLKVIHFYQQEGLAFYDADTGLLHFQECLTSPAFKLYSTLLDNFLESAYITLQYIAYVNFEKCEREKLEKQILEKGRLFYFKGELSRPEALSQFNIRNALLVYRDLGLVRFGKKELLLTRVFDVDTLRRWEEILRTYLHLPFRSQVKGDVLKAGSTGRALTAAGESKTSSLH